MLSVNSLFPELPFLPKGFSYYPDFLSVAEEAALLHSIKQFELHAFQFHGYEAKRKTASFGWDYQFDGRTLSKGQPIPELFHSLITKIAHHLSIHENEFKELLLTEYPPASVINWHRDAPPFDIICGVSLLEDCLFRLRPHDKTRQGKKFIVSLPVQRRSLYVMQGEARTSWQHSIAPVKKVRYSITLRTLYDKLR